MRFWRPPLYQLELLACKPLLSFAVYRMVPASRTEFLCLETFRILLLVLRHRVVTFFAVVALQCNDIAHKTSTYPSIISATVPAPTVRPPSRIANRNPF